jgi:hypothetical protein
MVASRHTPGDPLVAVVAGDGVPELVDGGYDVDVREPTAPDQPSTSGPPARREVEYVRGRTVDLLEHRD